MRGSRLAASTAAALLLAVVGSPVLVRSAALHAQTDLIALGDSITAGTGDAVPEGPNAGYPVRVQQMVPGISISNAGIPGERTFEALARLDAVLAAGGDTLLLMEGTNDLSRGFSIESIIFNLGEIGERAEDVGFEVVHATVIPRIPGAKTDGGNLLNRQLNQGIRDLAGREGRDLVDNFEVYSQLSNLFGQYYWANPNDRVGHPNPAGYDVMARAFADVIQGIDTRPPVAGLTDPNLGQSNVPPNATIRVDLWDFGSGIDLANSFMLVNDEITPVIPFGNPRGAAFVYQPSSPLAGVVTISVRTRDRSNPPHQTERVVSRFAVVGSEFLLGDFDASGGVDDIDLIQLAMTFGARDGEDRYSPDTDLDGSGLIDGIDLAILASNYGN